MNIHPYPLLLLLHLFGKQPTLFLKAKEMPVQHWGSSGSDWEAGKTPDLIFRTEQCEGGLFISHRDVKTLYPSKKANIGKEWTCEFGCGSWTSVIWLSLLTFLNRCLIPEHLLWLLKTRKSQQFLAFITTISHSKLTNLSMRRGYNCKEKKSIL